MLYHYEQLENGRWGIFIHERLVATVGCLDTCQKIVLFLEPRLSHPKIPVITEKYAVNQYFHDLKLRP